MTSNVLTMTTKGETHRITVQEDGTVTIDCHEQTHRGILTPTAKSPERACKIITDRYTPNAWGQDANATYLAHREAQNAANERVREEAEAGRKARKEQAKAAKGTPIAEQVAAKVKPDPKPKTRKGIKRVANQQAVPEGMTKYWCSGCMASFIAEKLPDACPEGHPATYTDDLAPVGIDVERAERAENVRAGVAAAFEAIA